MNSIIEAESRWHITLKKSTNNEYVGPCPFCNSGDDRFHVFMAEGNYWCRVCDAKGWIDDDKELTDHERRIRELEAKQRMIERKQREQEKRLSTLEKMHGMMHVADRYHRNITLKDNQAFEYWIAEGMQLDTIDKYKLGYCPRCPTDREHRSSYTIPVIIHDKLYNIRHRLIKAEGGDKYRPEIAGLPNVLFNADYLYGDTETIIIAEGEKKSIILAQVGFPNVGLMGKSGFKKEWSSKFAKFNTVYVLLDPDAEQQAIDIAGLFTGRGRVVTLQDKVDDLITRYGATAEDIEWFVKMGRPV